MASSYELSTYASAEDPGAGVWAALHVEDSLMQMGIDAPRTLDALGSDQRPGRFRVYPCAAVSIAPVAALAAPSNAGFA